MAKTDLRIIRTKANITRAFLELMDEFDYDSITVTDICDRAMVNRKTFYTYYETKEHLHQSISDSLLQSLKLVLVKITLKMGKNDLNIRF